MTPIGSTSRVPTCSPTYNVNCYNNIADRPGETANNPNVGNDNIGFFDDYPAHDQAEGGVRFVRCRYHSEEIDIHGGNALLPVQRDDPRRRLRQLLLQGVHADDVLRTLHPGDQRRRPSECPVRHQLQHRELQQLDYHGFQSRANLSWHVTDDVLLYYTWSQGFRPGGFNRGIHEPTQTDSAGAYHDQYFTPATYAPDTLTNNELGLKTEFLNHRLQINGAIYQEDWKNTIVEFFDPQQGFGNLTFVTNGPELPGAGRRTADHCARHRRSDGSGIGVVQQEPADQFAVPASTTIRRARISASPSSQHLRYSMYLARRAARWAQSPLFQGNMRARYEFPLADYKAFGQVGRPVLRRLVLDVGTVNNYHMGG